MADSSVSVELLDQRIRRLITSSPSLIMSLDQYLSIRILVFFGRFLKSSLMSWVAGTDVDPDNTRRHFRYNSRLKAYNESVGAIVLNSCALPSGFFALDKIPEEMKKHSATLKISRGFFAGTA